MPSATLVQAGDGNLWGTTMLGGANGNGAIFKITTAGTYTTGVFLHRRPRRAPAAGGVGAGSGRRVVRRGGLRRRHQPGHALQDHDRRHLHGAPFLQRAHRQSPALQPVACRRRKPLWHHPHQCLSGDAGRRHHPDPQVYWRERPVPVRRCGPGQRRHALWHHHKRRRHFRRRRVQSVHRRCVHRVAHVQRRRRRRERRARRHRRSGRQFVRCQLLRRRGPIWAPSSR